MRADKMTRALQKERTGRSESAKSLLKTLRIKGMSDAEIAFKIGACTHSLFRWRNGVVPQRPYLDLLQRLASEAKSKRN